MSMRTIQPETVRAATTVVVVVPIIFIYPFSSAILWAASRSAQ